jgi:hypothetical protein
VSEYEQEVLQADLTVAMDPDPIRLDPPSHRIPALLRKNIITPAEAEKLFKMYSLLSDCFRAFPDLLSDTLIG